MSYRYGANAGWGEIFGLSPNDLTVQQLEKINTQKLTELIALDSRCHIVLADRFEKINIADLSFLSNLDVAEINLSPYLLQKYNEMVRLRANDIETSSKSNYGNYRDRYIYWKMLDIINKKEECVRWIDNKDSVFNASRVDYTWLYNTYPDISDNIVIKVLYENSSSAIANVVTGLPKDPLLAHIDIIFSRDRSTYVHALSNKNTPKAYIVKALRAIAGRQRGIPSIQVELSKEILSELPPTMRLELLESLILNLRGIKLTFSDIKTSEDLHALLFGTVIKHTRRVQYVTDRFKMMYEKERYNKERGY
jgi:hypothetical protein